MAEVHPSRIEGLSLMHNDTQILETDQLSLIEKNVSINYLTSKVPYNIFRD